MRGHPPQRVTDAGADVDDPIPTMLPRERHDPIEILASRMGRALDVGGRDAAELALDRLDVAHVASRRLLYSTVASRW